MQRGITLIESLVVLGIMSLVLLLTFTGQGWSNLRHRMAADRLVSALRFARIAAIQLGSVVTLCPSPTGKSCQGSWRNGHMIFVDSNGNGKRETNEQVLRHYAALPPNVQLRWHAFPSRRFLRFAPSGLTLAQNGTFRYEVLGEKQPRHAIIVNQGGRARRVGGTHGH